MILVEHAVVVEMLRTGTTTFCEAGTLFDVPAVARAVDAVGLPSMLLSDAGRGSAVRSKMLHFKT